MGRLEDSNIAFGGVEEGNAADHTAIPGLVGSTLNRTHLRETAITASPTIAVGPATGCMDSKPRDRAATLYAAPKRHRGSVTASQTS